MQLDSGGCKCGHQWLCGLEATITIRVSLWRTLQAIIHHCIAHTPQSQPCTRKPGHLTLVAAPDLVATTIRLSVLPITKAVLNIKLLLVFLTPRSSIEMTPNTWSAGDYLWILGITGVLSPVWGPANKGPVLSTLTWNTSVFKETFYASKYHFTDEIRFYLSYFLLKVPGQGMLGLHVRNTRSNWIVKALIPTTASIVWSSQPHSWWQWP